MKLCRYDNNRIGLVRGPHVHDVTAILELLPPLRYPVPLGDQLIAHLDGMRERMERLADAAAPRPVAEVRLLSPVANPTKIIGTPVNYHAHVAEARADPQISVFHGGQPQRSIEDQGLFLKASSSLVGPSRGRRGTLLRPPHRSRGRTRRRHRAQDRTDRRGRCARRRRRLRDRARHDGPRQGRPQLPQIARHLCGAWPVARHRRRTGRSRRVDFSLHVNGELRQSANTRRADLQASPPADPWASNFYTLYPGDIIMSGTCQGVSQVKPGDVMTVAFERIGEMTVPVR